MESQTLVRQLITEITTYLEQRVEESEGVSEILSAITGTDLSMDKAVARAPQIPEHRELLGQAIKDIPLTGLGNLPGAIVAANPFLQWHVDRGIYYADGAEVGAGYAEGNMHCELIGPASGSGVYLSERLRLGLFLLGPGILYRDHAHPAAELYLNLTGPTGWRLNLAEWCDKRAGTLLWNPPQQVHATRVYDKPFLSVYAWTRDVHGECRVVRSDDWWEIERDLLQTVTGRPG